MSLRDDWGHWNETFNDSRVIMHQIPAEDEFIHKAKEQVNTFHTELYDLTIRLNMSLCAPLTSAGEDLLNALAKLELLKQSL